MAIKKTYNLDEIDTLMGKNEIRYRKTLERIQKLCPHDYRFDGGDHSYKYFTCIVCNHKTRN